MTPAPLTFALATTTKGHFGVKSRFIETLDSFNRAFPLSQYAALVAHIKISPGESEQASHMRDELDRRGFDVLISEGEWSHGAESHQLNYIADALRITNSIKTQYVLFCEDDWAVQPYDGEFIEYIDRAISYLEDDPSCMQVRIPRWSNEPDRIRGLMKKHGLNRWAHSEDQWHFTHDDFSMNPAFYRTRDLRAALMLTQITNLPKHIEHGVGHALKMLSGADTSHFACFEPAKIRIGHLGTLPGEEDPLDKPLYAN